MERKEFNSYLDELTSESGFDLDNVQKEFAFHAAKHYHEKQTKKMKIEPFRMKVDNQVEGIDVIAFLSRNGIGLLKNFSYPFNLILYKGDSDVLTMNDQWSFDKYENSIPLVTYSEHKNKYNY